MVGQKYYSPGITIKYHGVPNRWSAEVTFSDSGHANPKSTQGAVRNSYVIDLRSAIDVVKADAENLGIVWTEPCLFMHDDGRSTDFPPPENWQKIMMSEAARIGFRNIYTHFFK